MCPLFFFFSTLSWGDVVSHWLRFISSLCFDTSNNFLEDRPYRGKGGGFGVMVWTWAVTQSRPAPCQGGTWSSTLGCRLPRRPSHSWCCLQEEEWKKGGESYIHDRGKSPSGRASTGRTSTSCCSCVWNVWPDESQTCTPGATNTLYANKNN